MQTLHSNYSIKEFEKNIDEYSQIPLYINNSTIKYGTTVYPLRNISHTKIVKKIVIESKWAGEYFLLLSLAMAFFSFAFSGSLFALVFITAVILGFVSLIRKKKIEHTFYGLVLQTNSGGNDLFFSNDQKFIEKVSDIITQAMEQGSNNLNYSIHIGDKNFNDNSTTNVTNNVTNNVNLKVEHHNALAKDELEFLSGEFKDSIENLYTQLGDIKDSQVSREYLQKIADEISSNKPNPSKIKKYWKNIKGVTEGYEAISAIADFSVKIGKVAMMFVD